MKILVIAPTPFFADRGCHVRIYEEVKALQKLGCKVTICTYHNGRDIPGFDIRRIINIPWYRKLEAGPSLHMLYLDMLLLIKSLITALRTKPDIIHGHLHEGAFIGYVISKIMRRPLFYDSQGSLAGEMRAHGFLKGNRLFYKLVSFIERRVNYMADVVLANSSNMVRLLEDEYHLPRERIFLLPDGVDIEQFSPGIDTGELKAELGLPPGKKTVVYLGLLNEYQGVDCLLETIPLVLDEFKDVHFLVMGYPDVEKYSKKAAGLGISGSVTFTGRIDYSQAARYISLGEVAVSPKLSTTESNGKVFLYMACGLPTVVFETPVNREILGDTGVYAPVVGDAASLASALKKVLTDEALARKLGVQGRQRVVDNFTWDSAAPRLVELYKSSLNDSKRGERCN